MLSALKFLKPNQNNTGAGSVQVSKAGGSVHIDNRTQGEVTHVHVTNHIYATPPPPPRPPRPSELPPHLRRPTPQAHRDLLMLLVEMRPNDRKVFDFMEREFETRMVIDLEDAQLYRARRYAETVRERAAEAANKGAKNYERDGSV